MTKKLKTEIIVRNLPKKGGLESANLYIKNVPVYYACVHSPKKKYQQEEREFSVNLFVPEDVKDELLDEVMINKTLALVGKDKTTKGKRRIKYPLSSQVEDGKLDYDLVEGLYGFSVAKPEFSKKGTKMTVNVIDVDGNEFTEDIGNGSICTLKLFGYRNQDGQLVLSLDTVQVIEHVPYDGGGGQSGEVKDDVLGVSYKTKKATDDKAKTKDADEQEEEPKEEPVKPKAKAKAAPEPELEDDFDDSTLPF